MFCGYFVDLPLPTLVLRQINKVALFISFHPGLRVTLTQVGIWLTSTRIQICPSLSARLLPLSFSLVTCFLRDSSCSGGDSASYLQAAICRPPQPRQSVSKPSLITSPSLAKHQPIELHTSLSQAQAIGSLALVLITT